jgi:hypothetical protein
MKYFCRGRSRLPGVRAGAVAVKALDRVNLAVTIVARPVR